MTKTKPLFFKYFINWILISTVYLFLSEEITKLLFPGFDNVTLWLYVVAVGLVLILIIFSVSFFITSRKHK